jgi:hypothetical protein
MMRLNEEAATQAKTKLAGTQIGIFFKRVLKGKTADRHSRWWRR